jgi:hypothetical protein
MAHPDHALGWGATPEVSPQKIPEAQSDSPHPTPAYF